MANPEVLAQVARSLGLASRAVAGFDDHPFWAIDVAGADALARWQSLRAATPATGYWPVIIGNFLGPEAGGSDGAIEAFAEAAQETKESEPQSPVDHTRRTTAEILAAARELPFEAWVVRERDPAFQVRQNVLMAEFFDKFPGAERLAEHHRRIAEDWRNAPPREVDPGDYARPKANKNPPQHDLQCVKYFDSVQNEVTLAETVALLCMPTVHGWEVPAHLFYDHMQHERPAQVHVAALRWLHDQFGAELIGLQDRTLELLPRKRPATWAEAARAADQLTAYSHCPATSENELASASELAVFLMESAYWSFCWP